MAWHDFITRPKVTPVVNTAPQNPLSDPQMQQWIAEDTNAAKDIDQEKANKFFETYFGFSPERLFKIGYFKRQTVRQYTDGAYNLSAQLVSLWSQAVTSRRDYIMVSEELRKFYLVDRLLELITQDVLNADENGEIVKLVAKDGDTKLQLELDEFSENVDLNLLLNEMTQNFIDFGEYAVRLEVEDGKGLVRWSDDVDPLNLLAFYEGGYPCNYLIYKDKDFQMLPAHHYAHFIMGNNKLRVRMEQQLTSGFGLTNEPDLPDKVKERLPDYIKVGKPFFLGVISKLRELQLLEQLIPAAKLNQITQSQMVSLNVPAGTPADKAQEAVQQYEDVLNMPTGLDFTRNQISLAEILTAAGKIRVIPNWTDGKGNLNTMDIRKNQAVDDILNTIKDIRAVIMTSLGIPPSLLFGGVMGGTDGKFNELKLYNQYTRRLAAIQKALIRGLKGMILVHLVNKGIKVGPKDFDVIFVQTLVDSGGLERLEFEDAEIAILGRLLDFVEKMSLNPVLGPTLNKDGIVRWLQNRFAVLADGEELFTVGPDKMKLRKNIKKVANKLMDVVQQVRDQTDMDAEEQEGEDNDIDSDGTASQNYVPGQSGNMDPMSTGKPSSWPQGGY